MSPLFFYMGIDVLLSALHKHVGIHVGGSLANAVMKMHLFKYFIFFFQIHTYNLELMNTETFIKHPNFCSFFKRKIDLKNVYIVKTLEKIYLVDYYEILQLFQT